MKTKMKLLILPIFLGLILGLILVSNNVNAYYGSVVAEVEYDTYVRSDFPDTNYEGENYICSGKPTGLAYSFIYYNVSELRDAYYYGTFNDNVHLRFFYKGQGTVNDFFEWRIYRITESWDNSTVTYNTFPNISDLLYSYPVEKIEAFSSDEFVYLDIYSDFINVLEENVDYFGYCILAYPMNETYGAVLINAIEIGTYEGAIIYGYDEEEEEEEEGESWLTGDNGVNWFILAVTVLMPSFLACGYTREWIPPHITFCGMVLLMVCVDYVILPSLMPLWLVFIAFFVVAVLFIASFRRSQQ